MININVFHDSPMPDKELVRRLESLGTSFVSDVQEGDGGVQSIHLIAGLAADAVVAGPAFTVRTRIGDNLAVHQALELIRPGEVLVVAAGGYAHRSIMGGLMSHYALTKGVAAIVVDGAVRDISDLRKQAPPVFALGLNHLVPSKNGPGELRGRVSIGGCAVDDGDLVVCDENGVAIISRAYADDVVSRAELKKKAEDADERAIAAGTWDRSWIRDRVILQRPT